MKTLKATMTGLALILAGSIAGAAPITHHNQTKDEVADTYMNAVMHGDMNGVSGAIDNDAQFYTMHSARVSQLSKSQMLAYLKANPAVDQDCNASDAVLQDSDDVYVKKVDVKYEGVTRTDVITEQRTGDGWKITKVETSFK
ncbi:MAG: nuclear transport factor 2 family protein [Bacteroidetes bacterium]|nr:nuclear transport factor 2 family protein [Bacteroidota bacterium]